MIKTIMALAKILVRLKPAKEIFFAPALKSSANEEKKQELFS
jgi:hypothetical protein